MRSHPRFTPFLASLLVALAMVMATPGQETGSDEPPGQDKDFGWTNTADLSLVLTAGNSSTQSFGFDDRLIRRKKKSQFELKLNAVRTNTADDRYRQVNAGTQWPVGGPPPALGIDDTFLVEPPSEPDVTKYWFEPSYSKNISKKTFWTLGASWNRDLDAGLINRYVGYATFGNNWRDRDDLKFRTNYGVSYTDREENTVDPLKDPRFGGTRFSLYFMTEFPKSKTMTYENDWNFTGSIKDPTDYYTTMLQSLAVKMTKHLSLKVSLQLQYNNEPALEDIDLVARIEVVPCDFDPAQNCFETVDEGGAETTLAEVAERKRNLDTTFRTSLSLKF